MFTFTEKASYGTEAELGQRLKVAKFGDGYEQRSADGINSKVLRLRIVFAQVTTAKAARVKAFLEARGGLEAFLFTPPPPYEALGPLQFICRLPVRHRWEAYDCETIEATFEQDFAPVFEANAECAAVTITAEQDPDTPANMIVTLACATAGVSFRYNAHAALAGPPSAPSSTTGTVYAGPFSVPWGYVKAIAYKDGYTASQITAAYFQP